MNTNTNQKPEVIQQRLVRSLRAIREKHLRPMTAMTVGQIVNHIEALKLQQLKALLRAMDSCSTTNCGWTEYEVMRKYRGDVQQRITYKTNSQTHLPSKVGSGE